MQNIEQPHDLKMTRQMRRDLQEFLDGYGHEPSSFGHFPANLDFSQRPTFRPNGQEQYPGTIERPLSERVKMAWWFLSMAFCAASWYLAWLCFQIFVRG